MKGPAIFLAQFASDEPPFNDLESIAKWASEQGFIGLHERVCPEPRIPHSGIPPEASLESHWRSAGPT